MNKKPQVIIRKCADYDPDRIRQIVVEAIDEMGLEPHGRTLVKPNVVSSGELFNTAYTRPEFIEGVVGALKERGAAITDLAVGERCGITIPTRYAFSEAHYPAMAKRAGVRLVHFEEDQQLQIPLYHEGRLRDSLYTPKTVAEADFFVNCPKFKAHPWTTVTFSMKNYIGIQDDRHRLIDHDHRLNAKVSDLQYITQPQLIAIDAIVAGEGRMLTPLPFDMGLVLLGNNQVAFDAVCCALLGLDPLEVEHIRLAHERGFGPVSLDEIDITGDVSLDEAKERASGFSTGLIRVDDYFQGTTIRAYGGRPPSTTDDYCWGGCPGAMEEAIEILRLFDKTCDDKIPPMHIVFGKYEGEINAQDGERVVFIGDCAEYKGKLGAETVNIESRYRDRSGDDPLGATADDIFIKMAKVTAHMAKSRNDQVVRLAGCPVSVAEQVLAMVALSKGMKNPYLDLRIAPLFVSSYLSWRARDMLGRVFGKSYNRPGASPRGAARPPQNLPPEGVPTPLEA